METRGKSKKLAKDSLHSVCAMHTLCVMELTERNKSVITLPADSEFLVTRAGNYSRQVLQKLDSTRLFLFFKSISAQKQTNIKE